MEVSKKLAQENGNQASMLLGELTGEALLVQNGNQAGSALGELTDDELLAQNGNQAGAGVAEHFDELAGGPKCLTFTAEQGQAKIALNAVGSPSPVSLYYSNDNGSTWSPYTIGTELAIEGGGNIMMRGENETFSTGKSGYYNFTIEGLVSASGDISSLLNGVGGDTLLPENCFYFLFLECTGLTTAPMLPATTLAGYCYAAMFQGCTGLTSAPSLPATTLASNCYSSMFQGCTGLASAPSLPATTLASNCYSSMFKDCTGLASAPSLSATTLASNCYNAMFSGCTHITSYHVAALNNSPNVFSGNTSCASFSIDATTPPTIDSNTITGLKADCIIYVPAESVDAYKAAQYWSARSAYIQAKDGQPDEEK